MFLGGKWQKYYDVIEEANRNYKECNSDDCYKLQRRADFKDWVTSGGIQKKQFEKAIERKHGNHYQVIDGKLYRDEKCIFSSRYHNIL